MRDRSKELFDLMQDFNDKVHDLAFDTQDNAKEEEYHEFLKVLKLLNGSPLFSVVMRSTAKEYVRRFNKELN